MKCKWNSLPSTCCFGTQWLCCQARGYWPSILWLSQYSKRVVKKVGEVIVQFLWIHSFVSIWIIVKNVQCDVIFQYTQILREFVSSLSDTRWHPNCLSKEQSLYFYRHVLCAQCNFLYTLWIFKCMINDVSFHFISYILGILLVCWSILYYKFYNKPMKCVFVTETVLCTLIMLLVR